MVHAPAGKRGRCAEHHQSTSVRGRAGHTERPSDFRLGQEKAKEKSKSKDADKNKEEKKEEAEEKKEEAKDKAKDKAEDREEIVDVPGTDHGSGPAEGLTQGRRQEKTTRELTRARSPPLGRSSSSHGTPRQAAGQVELCVPLCTLSLSLPCAPNIATRSMTDTMDES